MKNHGRVLVLGAVLLVSTVVVAAPIAKALVTFNGSLITFVFDTMTDDASVHNLHGLDINGADTETILIDPEHSSIWAVNGYSLHLKADSNLHFDDSQVPDTTLNQLDRFITQAVVCDDTGNGSAASESLDIVCGSSNAIVYVPVEQNDAAGGCTIDIGTTTTPFQACRALFLVTVNPNAQTITITGGHENATLTEVGQNLTMLREDVTFGEWVMVQKFPVNAATLDLFDSADFALSDLSNVGAVDADTLNGVAGNTFLRFVSDFTAGNSTNATTTYSEILSVSLFDGNWKCKAHGVGSDSVSADGIKVRLNSENSGATTASQATGVLASAASAVDLAHAVSTDGTNLEVVGATFSSGWADFDAFIVSDGGGPLTLEFAQNAHTTGTATMDAGAYLTCEFIP